MRIEQREPPTIFRQNLQVAYIRTTGFIVEEPIERVFECWREARKKVIRCSLDRHWLKSAVVIAQTMTGHTIRHVLLRRMNVRMVGSKRTFQR